MSMIQQYLGRGAHKFWAPDRPAVKFCVVAPHLCGSSVWNFLSITLLEPKISMSFTCRFLEIYASQP